jgi:hypothetical protein
MFGAKGNLCPRALLFCPEKPGPSPHGGIFDGPSLSRIAGVRVFRLCLGVWCLKSQTQSTKLQINLKLQIPDRFNAIIFLFGILISDIVICLFFGICYLEFQ